MNTTRSIKVRIRNQVEITIYCAEAFCLMTAISLSLAAVTHGPESITILLRKMKRVWWFIMAIHTTDSNQPTQYYGQKQIEITTSQLMQLIMALLPGGGTSCMMFIATIAHFCSVLRTRWMSYAIQYKSHSHDFVATCVDHNLCAQQQVCKPSPAVLSKVFDSILHA